MLNKVTLAILGMGLTSIASAGTMGPVCNPDNVTVPCETRLWDVGIQALYLQPVYDADKAYGQTTSNDYFKELDNDWGWGYRIEGSYHFSTGNDITMSWVHYDVDTRYGLYQGGYFFINAVIPSQYDLFMTNQFEQVNLVMAQHANLGKFENVRFYGGLQYAKIKADGKLTYTEVNPVINALVNGVYGFVKTQYDGVGVVVGADCERALFNGFSVVGNVSGSILYGTSRYNDSTYYGSGLVVTDRYTTKNSIVPSIEMKLGAKYDKPMAQGTLTLEGGYMAFNYFNALQNYTALGGAKVQAVDYGMYGPYFGAKWVGNV